jgi:hypothetical protein
MTSVARELGAEPDIGSFADVVESALARELGREPVAVSPDELPSRPPAGRAR